MSFTFAPFLSNKHFLILPLLILIDVRNNRMKTKVSIWMSWIITQTIAIATFDKPMAPWFCLVTKIIIELVWISSNAFTLNFIELSELLGCLRCMMYLNMARHLFRHCDISNFQWFDFLHPNNWLKNHHDTHLDSHEYVPCIELVCLFSIDCHMAYLVHNVEKRRFWNRCRCWCKSLYRLNSTHYLGNLEENSTLHQYLWMSIKKIRIHVNVWKM